MNSKKFTRFIIGTSAIILLMLATLVIGLSMYTQTDGFRTWLREQTIVALHEVVHGDVELEQITGDVWNGVTFHNVSFRDAAGEVIQIPQAIVTLKLLSQLRLAWESSTFRINQVTIQSPMLHLVQKSKNIWNIEQLFPPSSKPDSQKPLRLLIDHIHVTNGHIIVEPQGRKTIQVHNVTANGQLTHVSHTLDLDIVQLSFRAEYPQFPPLTWEGGLTYKEVDSVADLSVKTVAIRTAQSQIHVSGTVQNLDAPRFDLTAQVARLAASELHSLFPESPLQQDLSGSIQLNGSLQHPTVKADLQTPDGKVTGVVKADLQQSPPYYEATVDLKHVIIHKVVQAPQVQGEVSGRVEFTGTDFDSSKVTFALRPTKLVVQERVLGDGECSGTIVNRRLSSIGKTHGQIGQLQWNGWIELRSPLAYEGTITVRNGIVANITKEPLSVGEVAINADAWIAGYGTTLPELTANARVTLLPSRVGHLTDIRGSVVAAFQQQQLTLEQLALTTNETTVRLQGQLKDLFSRTPQSSLSYNIQAQDVAPWLKYAGYEGQGALSLAGNLTGPLRQLTIVGTANGHTLRWGKNSLQNGTATYRLHSIGQADAHGEATASVQQLDAGGTWRSAAIDLTLTHIQPLALQATLQAEGEQVRMLRARVDAQQQPAQWDVMLRDLTVQLPTGTWTQAKIASLVIHTGQNRQIAIDQLVLQQGPRAVTVSGLLAEQTQQNIQMQIVQLPLADLHSFFTPSLPPIEGKVSAHVQVTGTLVNPEINANLTTSSLMIHGQSYAGLTGHGTYQGDRVTLNTVLQQDATHTLSLDGILPVSLHLQGDTPVSHLGEADLRLRSDGINIALLGLVTTDKVEDLAGIARVDLALRGPLSALQPSGVVRLRDGSVRFKSLDVSFSDTEAEIDLSPEFLELRRFTSRAGNGEVSGNGRLALQQYSPGNVTLAFVAKALPVIQTSRYKAAVSGQLTCSGSLTAPVVRGTLVLEDTTLRPNIALLKSGPPARDPTITVVQTEQDWTQPLQSEQPPKELNEKPELPPTPELLRQLAADVTIRIPRDTWIHMAEGSIEIDGNLTVKKRTGGEPRLTGALETVRGWYAFHGRKFNIERGQVTFPDTLPIEPDIDVVARYTVAPYDVDVVLGGTARTPTLELRSNPALEEADILSVLIFGKPANGLSSSEQVSLQTQAIQATAGYVASGLRQSIATKLGLDNLEFDMGQSIGQGRVRVGKYLIKDVYVSTSQQLGEKQEREVSVEYQIDRQWQLKGTTTSRGTSGVDVLWRKRY